MARLFDTGIFSVNSSAGAIGVGYKLYFYTTGTSTPKNTYPTRADAIAGTNANANPMVAAADGRWNPIWLTGGDYKVVLKDFDDVTLETRDPGESAGDSGALEFSHSTTYGSGTLGKALQQYISVKDAPYSATGDGSTDDSAAIQAAATAAATAGKRLFFPAGTYRLLSYVSMPTNTDWYGEVGSIIHLDKAMTLGTSIGGTARGLYSQSTSNVKLEKLIIQSDTSSLTKVVSTAFDQVTGLRLTDCTFKNFGDATYYAQGSVIFNSSDVRVSRCIFNNCSGDGLALSNGVTNFIIQGCEFSSNDDWGLALVINCSEGSVSDNLFLNNVSTATGADRCDTITFSGNTMLNNEHGIRVTKFAATADVNRNITITGNVIVTCSKIAISVEQSGNNGTGARSLVTITGNVINVASQQGINVSDSQDVTITGNAIYSTVAEGILIHATTAGWTTGNITVSGNMVNTCTYGIRQLTTAGTGGTITVHGNQIASASVADRVYVSANYVDGGQVKFPATQNASSDANTLDDYEEGTWTPVLTFATPGNLSVAYSAQAGTYTKIGNVVSVKFTIATSGFTHTTASGEASITGLPFTAGSGADNLGALSWQGITKASYTNVVSILPASTAALALRASGSGVAISAVTATDMPTGGSVILRGSLAYLV